MAERRNKATKGDKRGHPPFIPTDDQRRFVCAMAGIKMTWEEIRQLVINPLTDQPITKTTLARVFKRELADGKAKLKSIIATRFYEALERGDSWATQMGLKTQFGWKPDGNGGFLMPPDPGDGPRPTLNVVFVKPDPKMLEDDGPVVEHEARHDAGPRPGQRLLAPSSQQPMPDLSKRNGGGSWMD
jgi:hypothetical protein